MNPIHHRNRFAWSILAGALFIALGAAARSTDAQPANSQAAAAASPSSPAPELTPPAPPADPQPPSPAQTAPQPPSAAPSPPQMQAPAVAGGQWVFTSQYGWVWMPYAAGYTSVSADGSSAYMYVYYPDYGWRWVDAPWVLGLGPRPVWGTLGVVRFAWYAHPWFRVGPFHRALWHAHVWHRK